jgi:hypothetical protein
MLQKIRALLVVVFCLMTTAAFAQTGTITGEVADPTGAVISGAQITATSTLTSLSYTATTTSAGVYTLPVLPPSAYDITATANGFQAQTKKGLVLTVAATVPLDFSLAIAGASTTVSVEDVAPNAPETQDYSLSTVVESRQINDLPLILRDPYQLVLLSPGAVKSTNNMGGFAVNGQRERNNNFMLDGTDNNDTSVPGGGGGISSANPDSTQEFRVITNNFDAEFGRNTGAIIDVVTRAGTNSFHGDAYEFGRYSAVGARDFFNKEADGSKDPYVRNNFGASAGGPIWKDHSFFFLNGDSQRFRTTRTNYQTTPTAAFKSGKFTFIDPITGEATPVDMTNPSTNQNNLSGMGIDPTMAKVYGQMPVGQYDNGDGVSTTYLFPSPDPLNAYTFTGRFDHKINDKHQLTVRYIYGHQNDANPYHDDVLPGYGHTAVVATNHNGSISVASALTPTMMNLLKGGYNLNNAGYLCDHTGFDKLLGVDSFGNGRDIYTPYFLGATGGAFGCNALGDSNGQARLSSTLFLADTLNITRGPHTLKFGGEYRNVKDNNYDNFLSRDGLYLNNFFNYGLESYKFSDKKSPSYLNFEDMVWGLTGAVANAEEYQFFTKTGARRPDDYIRLRQHEFGLFAQDTWRVSSRLTLTAGLRYAFNGVPYEQNGNLSNLYGNSAGAAPAGGFAFTLVGPGTGRQLYADSRLMFEPRAGFAYDVFGDGKTAVRGGFGIFHDRVFDNIFGNAKANPPFQALWNDYPQTGDPSTPTVTTYPSPDTLTPSSKVHNGDYNTPIVVDSTYKMPTNLSWNLGVQRQIRSGLTGEMNYVGGHGTHGLRMVDGAPPQPALVQQYIQAGIAPSALTLTTLYTGDLYGTFGPAVYNTAFYHTYLQRSIANSSYNALQGALKGDIRTLTLSFSYTFAHALDDASDPLVPGAGGSAFPRNSYDLKPEYGNSDADVRHRGVASATYALPIGTGTQYLSHGFVGRIFEGIQLSGIQTAQTGLPFELRGTVDNLHTSLLNRPQMIGDPYSSKRGTINALGKVTGVNRAAFTNAPYDKNVSIHRNKFHGPGYVDSDLVFQKTQSLHESIRLQFRAECYNLFNHPNMAAPASGSISSPYFGISAAQIGQNDGTTGARQLQGALKLMF